MLSSVNGWNTTSGTLWAGKNNKKTSRFCAHQTTYTLYSIFVGFYRNFSVPMRLHYVSARIKRILWFFFFFSNVCSFCSYPDNARRDFVRCILWWVGTFSGRNTIQSSIFIRTAQKPLFFRFWTKREMYLFFFLLLLSSVNTLRPPEYTCFNHWLPDWFLVTDFFFSSCRGDGEFKMSVWRI